MRHVLDIRARRATCRRASQIELPAFLCLGMRAGTQEGRLRLSKHHQAVSLRVQRSPRTTCLDTALESSVVAFVRYICYHQIVPSLCWSVDYSETKYFFLQTVPRIEWGGIFKILETAVKYFTLHVWYVKFNVITLFYICTYGHGPRHGTFCFVFNRNF